MKGDVVTAVAKPTVSTALKTSSISAQRGFERCLFSLSLQCGHTVPIFVFVCFFVWVWNNILPRPLTPQPLRRAKRYLDDLDAQGVIVGVTALVEGKAQRLLPVDGDAVQVMVGQGQPYLQVSILLILGFRACYAAQYKCFVNDSGSQVRRKTGMVQNILYHTQTSLFVNDILWKMCLHVKRCCRHNLRDMIIDTICLGFLL